MKAVITKELIFDNFANKVTPLQRKQIDAWLLSQGNEELYYKWLEEWENNNLEYEPDSVALTDDYREFIQANPRPIPEVKKNFPKRRLRIIKGWYPAMVAAVALLFLTAGIVLFRDSISHKTYQTANGETKTFLLPDGSQVMLNARSSLRVPRWGFGSSCREVFLDGEARFSVRHTPDDRKFIVKTQKDFEVVVLGTEFSVFARRRGSRVVLNKGKVQLNYQQGKATKQLVMKPGQLVSFNQQNQVSVKPAVQAANFSLWQEKRFVFEETMLSDVAQMLEETYGLRVEIDSPELAHRKLMGSFRAENLDELLQTISDLLDINVVREEDTIRLSEKRGKL